MSASTCRFQLDGPVALPAVLRRVQASCASLKTGKNVVAIGVVIGLTAAGCDRSTSTSRVAESSHTNTPDDDDGDAVELLDTGEARGIRDSSTSVADEPWVGFVERTDASGIDFVHTSGTSPEKPFPAANGSGIGVIDFDADGRCDLFFATAIPFSPDSEQPPPRQRLYRNRGGWSFDDAEAAGLDGVACGAGVAVGDFDADGFSDVYLTCYGENRLFRNQGDGTFDETRECRNDRWATSAAFFDGDGDGLLDLYVCNYAKWTLETNKYCGDASRNVRIFCSPRSVEPEPDVYYRNAGDGSFVDATVAAGFDVRPGRSQGVVAADVDGDQKTDLYVGNDLNPNALFLAGGDGRYHDVSEASGAAYDGSGEMQAGMGVDVGDANGDGRFDLFVTNFEYEHNTLYLQGDGHFFNDASHAAGLSAPSLPWIGWGTSLVDLDCDGRPDLVVTNGHTDDNLADLGREGAYEQPPLLLRNLGASFAEVSAGGGSYFRQPHAGRALAVADFDDDLDSDLAIGHQDRRPALLEHDRSAGDGWPRLRVRLVGTQGNRDAIGATIVASDESGSRVVAVRGGGSYLSSHDLRAIVAAPHGSVDLEVRWPWGTVSRYENLRAADDCLLIEPAGDADARAPIIFSVVRISGDQP